MARYTSPKGTGAALALLGLFIGGAVIAGAARAGQRSRGRMQKGEEFFYWEVAEGGPSGWTVFVSDAFAEAPPEDRDLALAMTPTYYVSSLNDGLDYVQSYADSVL